MTCTQALDLVEAFSAGDIVLTAEARGHFESCPRCAAALATARRIEAVLAARPAPAAPDRFAASVVQRIRRERWRAEQQVDRLFNAAIALALVLVIGGAAALLNVESVLAAAAGVWALVTSAGAAGAREGAPGLTTYVAAAGLLVSALGMWWWADRRLSL